MNTLVNVKKNEIADMNSLKNQYQVYHTSYTDFSYRLWNSACDGRYIYDGTNTRVDMNTLESEEMEELRGKVNSIIGIDNKRENLIVIDEVKNEKEGEASDYYICLYNIQNKIFTHRFATNIRYGLAGIAIIMHVSEDDRYIYTKSYVHNDSPTPYAVCRLDTKTGEFNNIYVNQLKGANLRFVCVSPEDKYMIIAMESGKIMCIDIDSGKELYSEYSGIFSNYYGDNCKGSLSGTVMAFTSLDRIIYVYDYIRRQILSTVHISNINSYEYDRSADFSPFESGYYNISPYIGRGNEYLCLVYMEKSGSRVYADIVNASTEEVLHRISNTHHHYMSGSFIELLKEYGFHERDIREIQYRYRKNVIYKNHSHISGLYIAYSPESNYIAAAGYEHVFRPVICSFDTKSFEMKKVIYGNEYVIQAIRIQGNMLTVYASTIHSYSTINRWNLETGVLEDKHKSPKSKKSRTPDRFVFYGKKYQVRMINDNRNININDARGNDVALISPPKGKEFINFQYSNNPDTIYTKDDTASVYRWDIGKINEPGYRPFLAAEDLGEYQTPKQHINESPNGRYLAIKGKDSLYDTAAGKELSKFKDAIDYKEEVYVDNDLRFIMTGSDEKTVHIRSGSTNEMLEDIHFLSDGRFVIQTRPEKTAPNGWIYTNCRDDLNIFIRYLDGTTEILNPGSKIRNDYLMKYCRRDMVRDIMLNNPKYIANQGIIEARTGWETQKQKNQRQMLLLE
ncbi:MAG: WD40 repeat domain-containing protein [Clostridia bacterium]|nr:WD40 repeat domain-containing protein [Clostridia bacterium]